MLHVYTVVGELRASTNYMLIIKICKSEDCQIHVVRNIELISISPSSKVVQYIRRANVQIESEWFERDITLWNYDECDNEF